LELRQVMFSVSLAQVLAQSLPQLVLTPMELQQTTLLKSVELLEVGLAEQLGPEAMQMKEQQQLLFLQLLRVHKQLQLPQLTLQLVHLHQLRLSQLHGVLQ
jgi:hypothetical protein